MQSLLIILLSSFLWRVRGGLRINDKKLPLNKVWYAVFFAIYGCLYFGWGVELFLIGFIASYASWQLYGWGPYLGGLLKGTSFNRDVDAECELIDDLLYPCRITFGEKSAKWFNILLGWTGLHAEPKTYWLKDYGHLFGFCGTSLTGLIITFLWGLFLNDFWVMVSGLGMGVCYAIGGLINNEGKNGWNIGEWIFGGYLGAILARRLMC
jgi:hypothetical protein